MAHRKRASQEAQPILSKRRNNTLKEASDSQVLAIAGLVVSALAEGNAVYVTPGRFGGVQFKVYVEGDQFAEYIEINTGTDDLVEEILDTLYTQDTVAWYRKLFGARRAERPSKVVGDAQATSDTGKGGRGS